MAQLVAIRWWDTEASNQTWHDKDDPFVTQELEPVETVGFLVQKTDHHITITTSDAVNEWGQLLTIPLCAVMDWGTVQVTWHGGEHGTPLETG